MIRTPDEIKSAFEIQKEALADSCASYDEGKEWEAVRIATSVYTLVHDGGKNYRSILSQIGIRDSLQFVSSGKAGIPGNLLAETPLVKFRFSGGDWGCRPKLDEASAKYRVSVGQWWDTELVFKRNNTADLKMTHQRLTKALRDKDGGAHYDEELRDPNYIEFAYGEIWKKSTSAGEFARLDNLQTATMRQIGWELIETFELEGL